MSLEELQNENPNLNEEELKSLMESHRRQMDDKVNSKIMYQ